MSMRRAATEVNLRWPLLRERVEHHRREALRGDGRIGRVERPGAVGKRVVARQRYVTSGSTQGRAAGHVVRVQAPRWLLPPGLGPASTMQ